MKILKWVFKILIWIAFVILAFIGIRYLVQGGWTELTDKFNELDKNLWEWIKWFFGSMFGQGQ